MTWPPPLQPAGRQPDRQWASNEAMVTEWERHLRVNRFSASVVSHYPYAVRSFARAWKVPLAELEELDVARYVDSLGIKCKHLRPVGCALKLDLVGCQVLQLGVTCPRYQQLLPSGVLANLVALGNFYDWVVRERGAQRNPVSAITSGYLERHRAFWDDRRRKPNRRILTDDEVWTLVANTPPHLGIVVALMAGGFLRIHEAIKLRVDRPYLDMDARLITIPGDSTYGAKRQGINDKVWLNDSMRRILRQYLIWRDLHIARTSTGEAMTNLLCLTRRGLPWSRNGFQGNFKNALHAECRRLQLMDGRETQSSQRINPHAFRAWACTWAARHGANSTDIRFLKGDRQPGAIDMYVDVNQALEDLYKRYGPRLNEPTGIPGVSVNDGGWVQDRI
jgi:integrase